MKKPMFRLRPQPWFSEAKVRIESLAGLAENWDSYGASAINPRSIQFAIAFAYHLAMENVDSPVIGGTPDGNVGFSWDAGSWSLDAEVFSDGSVRYVYLDERDETNEPFRSPHEAGQGVPGIFGIQGCPSVADEDHGNL